MFGNSAPHSCSSAHLWPGCEDQRTEQEQWTDLLLWCHIRWFYNLFLNRYWMYSVKKHSKVCFRCRFLPDSRLPSISVLFSKALLRYDLRGLSFPSKADNEEEKLKFYCCSFCLCDSACSLQSLDQVRHVVSKQGLTILGTGAYLTLVLLFAITKLLQTSLIMPVHV